MIFAAGEILCMTVLSLASVKSSPIGPQYGDCPGKTPYWCPHYQDCFSLANRPADCFAPPPAAETPPLIALSPEGRSAEVVTDSYDDEDYFSSYGPSPQASSPIDAHADDELKTMLGEDVSPSVKKLNKKLNNKSNARKMIKSTKGQEQKIDQEEDLVVAPPKLSLKIKASKKESLSYDSMTPTMSSSDQGFSEDCTGLDVWCVSLAKCVDYKVYDSACSGKASKKNAAMKNNDSYPGRAAATQVCFIVLHCPLL